jgi:hypothetical protein
MNTATLPQAVSQFLETCPMAGQGLNTWLLRASNRLRHHVSPGAAKAILGPVARDHGRYSSREIRRQVNYAYGDKGTFCPSDEAATKKWPTKDFAKIERVCAERPGCFDLWESSPVRFEDINHMPKR